MTRDTKEELLLMMLLFGFLRLEGSFSSFPLVIVRAGLPSPNAGLCAWLNAIEPLTFVTEPSSLVWLCDSFGCSCMLGGMADCVLLVVFNR